MPYIIRDTAKGEHAAIWDRFRARAKQEGHSIAWVLWQLIAYYADHGITWRK